MGRWTLAGYANQVRLFLFLLVLFLVMQAALNFSLLFSARDVLSGFERDRVSETARLLAAALPRRPDGDWDIQPPPGVLSALERRRELAGIALLRPDGSIAASSEGPPSGEIDRDVLALAPSERRGFASGREQASLEIPWKGPARLVLLRPLLRPDGSLAGILKVVSRPGALTALDRQVRAFAVVQSAGVIAVLGLTFAFIRWMLRPYRMLVRTAAGALPERPSEEDAIQEPGELVSAFQAVVDKLQSHERDVERLWSEHGAGAMPPAGPVFRDMPSGLVATDRGGTVTAINPAAARILGVEEAGALGSPCAEVLRAAPDLSRLVEDCLRDGIPQRRVLVAVHRGARSSHVGASVSPFGGEGRSGVLCLFSDLTEIRQVEEKVRLRESLAEVGELSAGIAHEVRNALATILGYARLASRASEQEAREHAEAIRKEGESIQGVLSDYLRFARPVSLNLEPFDLGATVADVLQMLQEEPAAAGKRLERQGEWPRIEADEALIRQAVLNLARNAVEAVGEGGRVEILGVLRPADGEFDLVVHDDGPGPAEGVAAEDLFRPFFTTKREGTGLGLALVRKTVVYHDGRIRVDRGPWGGARFTVTLPLEAPGIARKGAS